MTLNEWNSATKKYQKDINGSELVVTYATAGHVVSEWYVKEGQAGLIRLVEAVRDGHSFDDGYRMSDER